MELKEQLEFFVARADALADEPLMRDGSLNTSFTLKWNMGSGMALSSKEPNEAVLRSALLLVRQFVSEKEPIFLNRIYNICETNLRSDELKNNLRQARKSWKASQHQSWLKMTHDGNEVTPTYIADLWINGHYFHSDQAKVDALRRLVGEAALFSRHVFLGYISETVGQILYLRNVIRYALSEGLLG